MLYSQTGCEVKEKKEGGRLCLLALNKEKPLSEVYWVLGLLHSGVCLGLSVFSHECPIWSAGTLYESDSDRYQQVTGLILDSACQLEAWCSLQEACERGQASLHGVPRCILTYTYSPNKEKAYLKLQTDRQVFVVTYSFSEICTNKHEHKTTTGAAGRDKEPKVVGKKLSL